jgi:hypothetical protein
VADNDDVDMNLLLTVMHLSVLRCSYSRKQTVVRLLASGAYPMVKDFQIVDVKYVESLIVLRQCEFALSVLNSTYEFTEGSFIRRV